MTQLNIFLSYNREDAVTAKCFADAFAAEGLTVWWDATPEVGSGYSSHVPLAIMPSHA